MLPSGAVPGAWCWCLVLVSGAGPATLAFSRFDHATDEGHAAMAKCETKMLLAAGLAETTIGRLGIHEL